MRTGLRWLLLRGFPLAGLLAVLASCASSSSRGRQKQARNGVGGYGKAALAVIQPTIVSALRQPVTTTRLGLAVLWHRPQELLRANLPGGIIPQRVLTEAPGTPEFESLLDRKRFPSAESGTLKWLVDGPEFFPELDRQIAAAKQSIQLQVFIFDNDDIAVRYADNLIRRANEVSVQVLVDELGSSLAFTAAPETPGPPGFVPPTDMGAYLRADSQVQVRRIFTPWLAADHTKLFLFDDRTAILGGMNIGREYFSEWHDAMVRVEGPVVGTLHREFDRAWRKSGPAGDLALLHRPLLFRHSRPVAAGIPLRVLRTDPAEGRHEILEATLLALGGARQRVWIETPYFANDQVARAVDAAARRGTDVRVILPDSGDSPLMAAANLATARGLIQAGAKVFRYPKMNHTKVMICDDWACFGSANLDTLSLRINRELNLAFSHPAAVQELAERLLLPDFRRSRRISLEQTGGPLNHVAEAVADQL